MLLTPLPSPRVPLSGQAAAGRSRRRAWWVAGSAALHLLALAAVLMVRRPAPDLLMAPSYELLFDNGGASAPPASEQTAMDSAPPSRPADAAPDAQAAAPEPLPSPPEPQQLAMAPSEPPPTPVPDALPPEPPPQPLPDPAPEPPMQPPPQAQAIPEPAPQAPVQQAMAPPLAPPAPPDAAPPDAAVTVEPAPPPVPAPTPAPPAVRLAQPDALAPSMTPRDLVPDLAPPAAPAPLPPLAPRPPRPRPAPPRPQFGSLGAPMDLNFGQAASRAPAPRGSSGSRAIDFSLGAPKPGPNKSEAFFDIRAANIGADWAQGLAAYWRRHRFYPQQAAENGEDGTVQVVLVVNRLGRVQSVEVKSRSGSPWLDMAAVATWRNAQLAPLPAENTDPTITIPLTINYILLR
jgi:TonB family protein